MPGTRDAVDSPAGLSSVQPKPTIVSLIADLRDEQREVWSLVSALDRDGWERPTTPDWTVRDQIAHLAYYDKVAAISIMNPERFIELKHHALADVPIFDRKHLQTLPIDGRATLLAWADAAERFRVTALKADPAERLRWFGPDMGLLSMISARLMETWVHGQDVADGLEVRRRPSDRLRHVAGLAVRSRAQGYAVRNRAVPVTPVRVELTAPNGDRWVFGPGDAPEWVRGPADAFCRVLTRRQHVDDTAVETQGASAREWMEIGQAYAGPPGAGPARRRDAREGMR